MSIDINYEAIEAFMRFVLAMAGLVVLRIAFLFFADDCGASRSIEYQDDFSLED